MIKICVTCAGTTSTEPTTHVSTYACHNQMVHLMNKDVTLVTSLPIPHQTFCKIELFDIL